MKNLFFYSIILAFIFASCEDENSNPPTDSVTITESPDGFSIDINEDGINDFMVEYNTLISLDEPTSEMSNIGSIIAMDNVQELYKTNDGYLFLEPNDTITTTPSSPLQWFSFGADVVAINWNINTGWDDNWRAISSLNEYYFAFKLQNGATEEIGWMKLDFNLYTGEMEVIDKAITSSSFIIVN